MNFTEPTPQMKTALDLAREELALGVQEEPRGSNTGPRVNQYLRSVGLGPGHPWCAAFVSWVIQQAEQKLGASLSVPKSAWTPAFLVAPYLRFDVEATDLAPGMLFMLYYKRLGRVGHIGFIEGPDPDNPGCIITIEGNSNDEGEREGYELCRRSRRLRDIHAVISY